MVNKAEKAKNFQWKLDEHRRNLIDKVMKKTRLGTKSKAIEKSLKLFLVYHKYFEEKYKEFKELKERCPLR